MVPWIYQAEINSLSMRVRGAAAATSMNWVGRSWTLARMIADNIAALWLRMHPIHKSRYPHVGLQVLHQYAITIISPRMRLELT